MLSYKTTTMTPCENLQFVTGSREMNVCVNLVVGNLLSDNLTSSFITYERQNPRSPNNSFCALFFGFTVGGDL